MGRTRQDLLIFTFLEIGNSQSPVSYEINAMAMRSFVSSLRRRLSSPPADSHSDFARVLKTPTGDTETRIKRHLDESKVVLYMKGLPSQPACGFSWKTVQILNALGVEYKAHNVLADQDLRQGIKKFSSWPTIPQLYVDGEFIGGSDIVESMARSGDLQKTLEGAGVFPASPQSSST